MRNIFYSLFFLCNLQRNNISSLSSAPSSSLANLTDLRWLILDHNRLQSVELERAALHNLTRLCYLFANHNRLQSVPASLPAGLQQLRLAHNHISSVSAGAFQKLHNLTVLLLQGNRLQTIGEGRLAGLRYVSLPAFHTCLPVSAASHVFPPRLEPT